jgi:carboxylesterase type B
VLVDLLLRTSLPLPIARAITQSGQSNTTISTPKSLAELDALYTGLKQQLNISALSELQAVPYTDLLDAYTKTDPAAGLRPSFLVDDYFFTEDWRESSFKGPVMIGNTGAEDCVLESYCALFPCQTPPPTLSTLVATLAPILGAPTLNSILTAYSISEQTEKGEMLDNFLKVVADVMLIKPAYDHALQWRKRGNEVQQYTFEQKQPFGGVYRGKAAHSLDIAYLHGKPEIFSGTTDPEGEIKMQRAMQDAWVRFAHGEEGWGKNGLVRRFGPGEVVDESVETVTKKWIRGEAWKSLEGLNAEQVDALVGLCSGFVCGFIGFETPS